MLPDLVALVHQLWGVDDPSVERFAAFVPRQIYLHNYDHPRSHLLYSPVSTLAREVPADPAHPITWVF